MYRAYCNGTEFGIDYRTLAAARKAAASYKAYFPHLRYYVRKAVKPRLSMLVAR